MRIQLDTSIVTPDHPVLFTVVGAGADLVSVRVLEWSGFVGHTPTIKTSTPERPRWQLSITRLPLELYAARQRVRVVVGITPQGAKRPIRKTLVLHLAPSFVELDEAPDVEPEPEALDEDAREAEALEPDAHETATDGKAPTPAPQGQRQALPPAPEL